MARIAVTNSALRDLRELVRTHRLPSDTLERVARSLRPLGEFPRLGAELGEPFAPRHFILGPWRWMIIVYSHHPGEGVVAVLAVVDGRTSTSPLANR